jgi:hypothetical protein
MNNYSKENPIDNDNLFKQLKLNISSILTNQNISDDDKFSNFNSLINDNKYKSLGKDIIMDYMNDSTKYFFGSSANTIPNYYKIAINNKPTTGGKRRNNTSKRSTGGKRKTSKRNKRRSSKRQ